MVSGHRPYLSHIAYLGLAAALANVSEPRPVEAFPRVPAPKTAAEIRAEAKRARKNARRLANLTPES